MPGALLGFVGGAEARRFAPRPPAERRLAVLASFARAFGSQALTPIGYIEANWPSQRYALGGPIGIAPPGVLTACGPALREPVGRIHWAGSETSTYWNGYVDGGGAGGRASGGRGAEAPVARAEGGAYASETPRANGCPLPGPAGVAPDHPHADELPFAQ